MATQKTKYYKHPEYGTVYGEAVPSPTGRLAWPSLVKPKDPPPSKDGQPSGAPRYEATIILPKKDKGVQAWVKMIEDMAAEMLPLFNQGRKGKVSIEEVIKDGDTFDLEKYPYYKDSLLLVARNTALPPLADGKKQLIPAEKFEGGCFVRGTVTPILTGWGISYKLQALQLVKDDGTRFAGASRGGSYLDMLPMVESDGEEDSVEEEIEETPATGKKKALDLL